MKIAFLSPEYPHPRTGTAGGIGSSILNLAKGLVAQNHKVSILVYGQQADEVFEENGITIYKIKNIKIKGLSLMLTQWKVQRLINHLYKEKKIDLVEAPDWTGFTAFVRSKCPLVIRLNGSDTYFCHLDQRPVKAKNSFLEKRALQKADGIISVSAFTASLTKELFHLDREMTIIPNSVDMGQFEPMDIVPQPNSILYFGTLIRKKGLLELPHIFNEVIKQNPKASLTLIGKDSGDKQSGKASTWQLMQPLFSKAALERVHYVGPVPYHEIKKHIAQVTVCVFPTFAEALPVSWIEAMVLKKPIVASNIGWAPEVIDDGENGYLVHPKDHQTYAQRILQLLEDEQLQHSFGEKAREKVKTTFSTEVVARESVGFYGKFLKP